MYAFCVGYSGLLNFIFITQPLPTKINLTKRRAREGRSGDEIEHFSVPSRVTVRKRAVAATIEQRDLGVRT